MITPEIANILGVTPKKDQVKHTVKLIGEKSIKMPFISFTYQS